MTPLATGLLPEEMIRTQAWLHEVFKEASRGLPWPQQAGLLVVEQLIVLGMFGGLLTSAMFLQELRAQSPNGPVPDLTPLLRALESATVAPLPPAVQAALREFAGLPLNYDDLPRAAAALVEPLLSHFRTAPRF